MQAITDALCHFRYTPNLTRKVTHVLVEASGGPLTDKMRSLRSDRATWALVEVVALEWLAVCTERGEREAEHRFRVLLPVVRRGGIRRDLRITHRDKLLSPMLTCYMMACTTMTKSNP